MSTEIGAKKQRNWLLDFLRIPAGFCIAINHFMQRWCDSLESVYGKRFVKGVFSLPCLNLSCSNICAYI